MMLVIHISNTNFDIDDNVVTSAGTTLFINVLWAFMAFLARVGINELAQRVEIFFTLEEV